MTLARYAFTAVVRCRRRADGRAPPDHAVTACAALRLRLDVEAHPDQPADHNGGAPKRPCVEYNDATPRADQFGYYISQSVPQSAANQRHGPDDGDGPGFIAAILTPRSREGERRRLTR